MSRRSVVVSASIFMLTVTVGTSLLAYHPSFDLDAPSLTRSDEPGGTEFDADLAKKNPDEYAWQLFFFLNRQASDDLAGVPDPAEKTFREAKPGEAVVWEGWALASGEALSEVFTSKEPRPWGCLKHRQAVPGDTRSENLTETGTENPPSATSAESLSEMAQAVRLIPPRGFLPRDVEIRYNREIYNTIRSYHLWSREGIAQALRAPPSSAGYVEFKPAAKAIKANWTELCDGSDKPCNDTRRYHWRKVQEGDGRVHIWGLAALHIMTKDTTHWFWADFIHEDCLEGRKPCAFFDGVKPKYIDVPRDSTTANSHGVRKETRHTPWQNYRLMGTQNDLPSGPVFDPRIESGQRVSSCVTCHFYASACASQPEGQTRPRLYSPDTSAPTVVVVGSPDESLFKRFPTFCTAPEERRYLQSDFLWSLQGLARSEKQEN